MTLSGGTCVGLCEVIDAGGMDEVDRARDQRMGREWPSSYSLCLLSVCQV